LSAGFRPDPLGGAYSAPQTPWLDHGGREWKGQKEKQEGREGEEGKRNEKRGKGEEGGGIAGMERDIP